MPYVATTNSSVTLLHIVKTLDGSGTVSGEAANLTYILRDESGNTQTSGVTIAEQGSTGYYDLTFTPDADGNWHLAVKNPAGTDRGTYNYYVQSVASAAGLTPSGTLLSTLANLKERLGITGSTEDTYLTNLLRRASARIEAILGRTVVTAVYTEFYDGDGTTCINLRQGPVTSVSSLEYVSYDGAGGSSLTAYTANGDFFLRGDETNFRLPGYLEFYGSNLTNGQQNYKVVYTAGYSSVPYDIEQACLHAAVWFRNERKDTGSSGRDVGDGSLSLRENTKLDDDLRTMLQAHTDMRFY